jgi:serine/threonine protein kinase
MPNLLGKDLGRYHIVEQLGKGGMAYVYKAYDNRLDRFVALKVIIASQEDNDTFLKRFDREAKALARLSHPHIVKVHDYGEEDGSPYLVMEYLEGGSLREKMGTAIPYADAARLLIPMCQALQYAHQMKIVHRDVKPANILLTRSGIPMLTDFGIAKIVAGTGSGELTGTGVGIGTPDYMSPEQGQAHNIDARSDIYSLGVVFYELVTGVKPFRADTPMATILKHITEPLPRPRLYISNLPNTVENIIFKAMAKNPDHRYQSMSEFANALERLVVTPSRVEETPPAPFEAETIAYSEQQATAISPQREELSQTRPMNADGVIQATPDHLKATVAIPQFQPAYTPNAAAQETVSQPGEMPVIATPKGSGDIGVRILKIALIFLASLFLLSCVVLTGGAFFLSNTARNTVASSEFIPFQEQTKQTLFEYEANDILSEAIRSFSMYISSLEVDFKSPDTILFHAKTSIGSYTLEIQTVTNGEEHKFVLKKINNIPLLFIGSIVSNGINSGFDEALTKYHLKLNDLFVSDDAVTYEVTPTGP